MNKEKIREARKEKLKVDYEAKEAYKAYQEKYREQHKKEMKEYREQRKIQMEAKRLQFVAMHNQE